jgi:predicted AlkP superfamily phosphohydrolase/phosphomutase
MRKPSRMILIGLDGAFPEAVKKYAAEGVLPNFQKLLDGGVFFENCYCPTPTITPPNWTTIATGSTVGTHGITCFHYHPPGTPLDTIVQNFDCERVRAEYMWEAAERAGKRSLVLSYVTTWPPRGKNILYAGSRGGGGALNCNYPGLPDWQFRYVLGLPQMFNTEIEPLATRVELNPNADGSFTARLPIECRNSYHPVREFEWTLRIIRGSPPELRDHAGEIIGQLNLGSWHGPVSVTVPTEDGDMPARCMLKLLELDLDEGRLRLYRTPFHNTLETCHPPDYAREVNELPCVDSEPHELVFLDPFGNADLYVEGEQITHSWLAGVVEHAFAERNVDLVFLHCHTPDNVNHPLRNYIEGTAPDVTPEKQAVAEEIERRCYMSYDTMLGKMWQAAGANAMIVIVSDHGSIATRGQFNASVALKQAGLLATKPAPDGRGEIIDWGHTKAVPQRACYVYVNLKGRDPQGIVEPAELEHVKDGIICALLDYTDPELQMKPVAFALKREEARWIGLFGDDIGDVVYAIRAPFGGMVGGVHGVQAPFAQSAQSSMRSLLMMAGPGLRKGVALERNVGLEDIVPTACYLLDIPPPRDVEGGIIYQALEHPGQHVQEAAQLRSAVERLENLVAMKKAQTHSYEH